MWLGWTWWYEHRVQPITVLEVKRLHDSGQVKSLQWREMNGIQCKLARIALGWGVRELAATAKVSTQTISRFEGGDELRISTVTRIVSTFENAGIKFLEEGESGFGIWVNRRK